MAVLVFSLQGLKVLSAKDFVKDVEGELMFDWMAGYRPARSKIL
jgi:hypothetical protein